MFLGLVDKIVKLSEKSQVYVTFKAEF